MASSSCLTRYVHTIVGRCTWVPHGLRAARSISAQSVMVECPPMTRPGIVSERSPRTPATGWMNLEWLPCHASALVEHHFSTILEKAASEDYPPTVLAMDFARWTLV